MHSVNCFFMRFKIYMVAENIVDMDFDTNEMKLVSDRNFKESSNLNIFSHFYDIFSFSKLMSNSPLDIAKGFGWLVCC